MDIMSEFERRRGATPASNKPLPDTRDVLLLAFANKLHANYLIPVLPAFKAIFGQSIWLCVNEATARRKQREEGILAFTGSELLDVVEMSAKNMKEAAGVVATKRTFGGTIAKESSA